MSSTLYQELMLVFHGNNRGYYDFGKETQILNTFML